jgi:single-stranded-DNA-specific exonuclease
MQKRWFLKSDASPHLVNDLKQQLSVNDTVASMLVRRDIFNFEEAKNFFRPSLSDLHDPFLMLGMRAAVARVNLGLAQNEKILIYGDYDVDGTTSVALCMKVLHCYSSHLSFYIPDRYTEGYGISFQAIDFAEEQGISLIIALDCGIRANKQIAYANEKNIDFIVCDHHLPGEILPACIILNPKQKNCNYPFKELSGCGVGFKLMCGLAHENGWPLEQVYAELDILATSIAADLVQITGENRILSYFGLKLINENKRPAIKALLQVANFSEHKAVDITNIMFIVAPRINAAGRLESGNASVSLLLAKTMEEAMPIALAINELNAQRRDLDASITEEAFELLANVEGYEDKKATVVFDPSWHKGVIGIVASRLKEKYYRPTIVLTESNGELTGSARSVDNFDVHAAIDACGHLLTKYGGHAMAAGLSMLPENLEQFKIQFEEEVAKQLQRTEEVEEIPLECELNLQDIFKENESRAMVPQLKRILNQFEPHGPGNMKPVFLARSVYAAGVNLLKGEHIKMDVFQENNTATLPAIGFRMPEFYDLVTSNAPFDLAFTLEINEWIKNSGEISRTIQLNVKDIRPALLTDY